LFSALILFGFPADPREFEDYFANRYHPLLRRVPNLEGLKVNRIAGAAKGEPPFYALVEMQFASEAAMQDGLNSEEGQTMARELASFASGGYTVVFSRTSVDFDPKPADD
jgi:uncharacterized protein (TIGR02118 family)